jgi:hypothetical protein
MGLKYFFKKIIETKDFLIKLQKGNKATSKSIYHIKDARPNQREHQFDGLFSSIFFCIKLCLGWDST